MEKAGTIIQDNYCILSLLRYNLKLEVDLPNVVSKLTIKGDSYGEADVIL